MKRFSDTSSNTGDHGHGTRDQGFSLVLSAWGIAFQTGHRPFSPVWYWFSPPGYAAALFAYGPGRIL